MDPIDTADNHSTAALLPRDEFIPPPSGRYMISNPCVRYTVGGVCLITTIAVTTFNYSDLGEWQDHPAWNVIETLGTGAFAWTSLEILCSDATATKLREIGNRFAFPLSMIIAQLARNPIHMADLEAEEKWKIAFSDLYNAVAGGCLIIRIASIFRKKLAEEPIAFEETASRTRKRSQLFLENSLVATQVIKALTAAGLITCARLLPETTPYTSHPGFLLTGSLFGTIVLGKGLDRLEKALAARSAVGVDDFQDVTTQWDALRIFNMLRKGGDEISGATIGVLFALLTKQSSLINAEIINFTIGAILASKKAQAEKILASRVSHLGSELNPTVVKTKQVWAVAGCGAIMTGWYGYMLYATWEDTRVITVLSSFVGCSFASFFGTLLLNDTLTSRENSNFFTSLKFYFNIFRAFPFLFLYLTQELNTSLEKQAVETSEGAQFGFEVAGWAALGLSMGNHLAQRSDSLTLSDFIFAVFTNSLMYEFLESQ